MNETSVYCGYKYETSWQENTTPVPGINVYRIKIPDHLLKIREYTALLSADEIRRARNYHHQKDSERFIISRAILRLIVASQLDLAPCAIRFGKGENKKPFIENCEAVNLEFNVTHSGDWIVIATGGYPVGADIECVDPEFEYAEIMAFAFHKLEIDYINSSHCPRKHFFLLWSRKESLLKATGKGIGNHLSSSLCLDGDNIVLSNSIGSCLSWSIYTFYIDNNYVANIAFPGNPDISFHSISVNCFDRITE